MVQVCLAHDARVPHVSLFGDMGCGNPTIKLGPVPNPSLLSSEEREAKNLRRAKSERLAPPQVVVEGVN